MMPSILEILNSDTRCAVAQSTCKNFVRQLLLGAVVCVLALNCASKVSADGDWRPKDGPDGMPQFVVPPGEDPAAHAPSHWGLIDKTTRPAHIPSIEKPTTNVLGPRPDYRHQTSFGKYDPAGNSRKRGARSSAPIEYEIAPQTRAATTQSDTRYPSMAPTADPGFPSEQILAAESYAPSPAMNPNGYLVQQPLPSGVTHSPLLRLTAREAAYQPSPYHVKEESPPLGEILKTGAYFVSYESQFLLPHFQGNPGVTTDRPSSSFSRDFDFGLEHASKLTIGFESQKGPGVKLTHLELFANSDQITGRSNGTQTASSSIYFTGAQRASVLSATNAGERIDANHRFWIKNTSAIFFKEIKMPISRLNGMLGFRYTNIHHTMRADLFDSSNTRTATLHGTHYFRGLGPTIGLEYFRPIGHTSFEFLGGATTTLQYGNRDQVAFNTQTREFTRFGSDELVSITDAKLGAQWVREWGRRYHVFARGTIIAQSWYGGGTASDPIGDFGLFGLAFAAGLNH